MKLKILFILILFILIIIAVSIYIVLKMNRKKYFSESFKINEDEYACQNLEQFNNFKEKLNSINQNNTENDSDTKLVLSNINITESLILPKLKNNYVLCILINKDTTFNELSRNLLFGKFNSLLESGGLYNKDKNELLEIIKTENNNISLNELKDDEYGVLEMKNKINKII
jgi:hypothetical protein